ncbi:MAG: hypothetical protein K1X65_06325 [Caldilineales bacterium]|nr:hypothetical protein [Caldilineales bacterium]MCW5857659.1 hypothetical protein [Caldilineales bacterium]
MFAVKAIYENHQIRLLEPAPEFTASQGTVPVAVLFLTGFDAGGQLSPDQKEWGDDDHSYEQAELLQTVYEEMAPYYVQALKAADMDSGEEEAGLQ